MNNGNIDFSSGGRPAASPRPALVAPCDDELSRLKLDLMKAEVRLAKARATVVAAEVDIKVLNARLKAVMKG